MSEQLPSRKAQITMTDDMSAAATGEEESATAEGEEEEFSFVGDPSFDIDYKGDCAYEVKVSVPAANETKTADELYEELRAEAELPGFRRGKVPRKLLENKFSKAVRSDVEGKLVGAAFKKLTDDNDLEPLGMPDIDGLDGDEEREPGAPLDFTLKFEVKPKIELGQYRGIEVERPVVEVDDVDVDESIGEFLKQGAVYETVEDSKAGEGDQVIIDFEGTRDGEAFEGGTADNLPYIIGSNRFLPEFETALAGASAGDELTADVTFPEEYFAEELRGKPATFSITVHEVKRQAVPELTDEFAEQSGYENVADMREKIAERMRERSGSQSRALAESDALNKIIEGSTYELPVSLVDNMTQDMVNSEVEKLAEMKISPERIEERMEGIESEAREAALRNIKSMVALYEIAEAEGVEVTEEDFEKEAQTMSKALGMEADLISRYMTLSDQSSTYADRLLRTKTLDVILDNAKVTDKELSRGELDEEDSDDEGTGE
ncbi:MAG: trigger factor [Candidatus Hydrogenedentes bacterium]|nr:trigger factor [Candidatus Hydrogenedentota bacterium]